MAEGKNMAQELTFHKIDPEHDFPDWAQRPAVVHFLHEKMKPYEDKHEDIEKALDYCLNGPFGKSGFIMLARHAGDLVGVLVMLNSGMEGYIPGHILLFVGVEPERRGLGIGRRLIEHCLAQCDGPVKLHVEYDNPAKRLYERIGFSTKYAEMRYVPKS